MIQTILMIKTAAMLAGLNPFEANIMVGICHKENLFRNKTKWDVNSLSYGLCQIKAIAARDVGYKGDPNALRDPFFNAYMASKYFKKQIEDKRNRTPYYNNSCNEKTKAVYGHAISAYNAGRLVNFNRDYVKDVKIRTACLVINTNKKDFYKCWHRERKK